MRCKDALFISILAATAAHSASPFVADDVVKALRSQKTVRVVVETEPLQGGGQQSAQAHISQLLAGTSGSITPLDDRAVLLQLSSTSLGQLQSDHRIRSIYRDVPAFPTLTEVAPISGATNAWKQGHTGNGATIALLDTGVDGQHPFLNGKITFEACFSIDDPTQKVASLCKGGQHQGQSVIDTSDGAAEGCAKINPQCEHGTHVAGIAVGRSMKDPRNPARTISGIAPEASVAAIQVFSRIDDPQQCPGYKSPCVGAFTSSQIRGLQYVLSKVLYQKSTNSGPKIVAVNMSLGSGKYPAPCDTDSPLTRQIAALRAEGVVTFIAAGNDGYADGIAMPACISSAVAVGAADKPINGAPPAMAAYSNRFEDKMIGIVAVGSNVYSSLPNNKFGILSGTSMATPVAAAAFAILAADHADASADLLLTVLKNSGARIVDPVSSKTLPLLAVDKSEIALNSAQHPAVAAVTSVPTPSDAGIQALNKRFIAEFPGANASTVSSLASSTPELATALGVDTVGVSSISSSSIVISTSDPVDKSILQRVLQERLKQPVSVYIDEAQPAIKQPTPR